MADAEYRRLTCGRCLAEFAHPRQTKFCSKRCRDGSPMTREEYRESVRKDAPGKFTCEHCGVSAYRKVSGTNLKNGYSNRFCSQACRSEQAAREAAERRIRERAARPPRVLKPYKPFVYVRGVHYTPAVRTCVACGCQWCAVAQRAGSLKYCSNAECQQARRKAMRTGRGKSHIERARRHGNKYSYFNVNRVFERDKWKCQICGVKTPKKLRGTMDDRAPEIDHILAISLGGDHVIENCQCACRRCNADKGASGRGQMWLSGFADSK